MTSEITLGDWKKYQKSLSLILDQEGTVRNCLDELNNGYLGDGIRKLIVGTRSRVKRGYERCIKILRKFGGDERQVEGRRKMFEGVHGELCYLYASQFPWGRKTR